MRPWHGILLIWVMAGVALSAFAALTVATRPGVRAPEPVMVTASPPPVVADVLPAMPAGGAEPMPVSEAPPAADTDAAEPDFGANHLAGHQTLIPSPPAGVHKTPDLVHIPTVVEELTPPPSASRPRPRAARIISAPLPVPAPPPPPVVAPDVIPPGMITLMVKLRRDDIDWRARAFGGQ